MKGRVLPATRMRRIAPRWWKMGYGTIARIPARGSGAESFSHLCPARFGCHWAKTQRKQMLIPIGWPGETAVWCSTFAWSLFRHPFTFGRSLLSGSLQGESRNRCARMLPFRPMRRLRRICSIPNGGPAMPMDPLVPRLRAVSLRGNRGQRPRATAPLPHNSFRARDANAVVNDAGRPPAKRERQTKRSGPYRLRRREAGATVSLGQRTRSEQAGGCRLNALERVVRTPQSSRSRLLGLSCASAGRAC